MSKYCNFPDLNDTLRDRLVCGLRTEQTQKKLLSMQALTLEKAIQISIAMETATKDAMELQGKQHESTVHKVKMNRPKPKVDNVIDVIVLDINQMIVDLRRQHVINVKRRDI
jgi:predicted secreted acid phosphatase